MYSIYCYAIINIPLKYKLRICVTAYLNDPLSLSPHWWRRARCDGCERECVRVCVRWSACLCVCSPVCFVRLCADILTSLYSWIWLCSNMENTLEEPLSPPPALLLAFLGAWRDDQNTFIIRRGSMFTHRGVHYRGVPHTPNRWAPDITAGPVSEWDACDARLGLTLMMSHENWYHFILPVWKWIQENTLARVKAILWAKVQLSTTIYG